MVFPPGQAGTVVSVLREIAFPGAFAREALEHEARARGLTPEGLVRVAIEHLLADRRYDRPARRVPRLNAVSRWAGRGVAVAVDEECWTRLEAEAGQQHVAAERLAGHGVLLLLADLEAGSVAPSAHRGEARPH